MERMVLQVSGMTCMGCEERIGTVLRRLEGVRGVIADHVCGRVEIRIDPDVTDRLALTERIENAGFHVVEEVSR